MTVFEIVQLKTGVDNCPHIEIAVEEASDYIKNYCRIEEIPLELKFVWANMAIGLLQGGKKEEATEPNGPLSSVSMGGTSYSFATDRKTNAEYVTEIAGDFKAQLNRFRKGLFSDDNTD